MTESAFAPLNLVGRVLASSAIAVFVVCLFFGLGMAYASWQNTPAQDAVSAAIFLVPSGLVMSVFFFFWGFVIVSPLVAFAVVCALLFRHGIAQNLEVWCLSAPVVLWIATFAVLWLFGDDRWLANFVSFGDSWNASESNASDDQTSAFSLFGALLLLSFVPGALAFYGFSRRAMKRLDTEHPRSAAESQGHVPDA